MRPTHQSSLLWFATGVLLVGQLAVTVDCPAAEGLDRAQQDGYLQWLHSLEQTVSGREQASVPESRWLFPFDARSVAGAAELTPHRYLVVSKALTELEDNVRWGDAEAAGSALTALSTARSYNQLAEHDSALVWLDRAARLDTAALFTADVAHLKLATMVVLADSTRWDDAVAELMAADPQTADERQVALVLRRLVVSDDAPRLDELLAWIAAEESELPLRLRYWYAFALASRRQLAPSVDQLLTLITAGGLSSHLSDHQRVWVLTAIPDQLFLLGELQAASDLYRVLAVSSLPTIRRWGELQQANVDFLEANYLRAGTVYERLCSGRDGGRWRDYACEMATLAAELGRIYSEGEPYGAAAFYSP